MFRGKILFHSAYGIWISADYILIRKHLIHSSKIQNKGGTSCSENIFLFKWTINCTGHGSGGAECAGVMERRGAYRTGVGRK